jgi:hypothetical protein
MRYLALALAGILAASAIGACVALGIAYIRAGRDPYDQP